MTDQSNPTAPAIFAPLRSESCIWAFPAIHGEAERLAYLHSQIASIFRPGDQVVYLGGYFGYGPAVRETIDQLLLFRRYILSLPDVRCEDIVYLRGQQEEIWHKLLQLQFAPNAGEVLQWMLDNGAESTIRAYGSSGAEGLAAIREGVLSITKWTSTLRQTMRACDGHTQLTSVLRHAAYTDNNSLLFVHAGIDAARPLSAQNDSFWWGGASFADITEPYGNFELVVRGYDRKQGGVEIGRHAATIDAGSGQGGPLVAVCFEGANIVQVLEA